MVLEGCFDVGGSWYSLGESSIFSVRVVFGLNASHIFLQECAGHYPLDRGCD